jgi:hypothetical protein
MHDKFMVFVKNDQWSVWTGSFNCSVNSGHSLENAVLIRDGEVAKAYLKEWQQIFLVSESRSDDEPVWESVEESIINAWKKMFEKLEWEFSIYGSEFTVTINNISFIFTLEKDFVPESIMEKTPDRFAPKPVHFILNAEGCIAGDDKCPVTVAYCAYCKKNTFTTRPSKRNCILCGKTLTQQTIDVENEYVKLLGK